MLTLQKLKYVVTVAQHGSFHKAARALFISQPSLSTAIQEIEEELNITIFRRTNRGVQLTPSGMEFLPYAHQILQAMDFIENRYSKETAEGYERFSVSSHHNCMASAALARLQNENISSKSEFHYRECTTLEVLSDVAEGKSDIGVLCINKEGIDVLLSHAHRSSLEFTPLAEVTPYVFVRKGHPLTELQSIFFSFNQSNLSQYPFVGYYQGSDGLIEFVEEFVDIKYPARGMRNIFVNDRQAKIDIILKTDSYTSGPKFFQEHDEKFISKIPIINSVKMVVGWIRRSDRNLSSVGSIFLEKLQQEL